MDDDTKLNDAVARAKKRAAQALLRGINDLLALDLGGDQRLIRERTDMLVHLDMLRTTLNPKSRRLRFFFNDQSEAVVVHLRPPPPPEIRHVKLTPPPPPEIRHVNLSALVDPRRANPNDLRVVAADTLKAFGIKPKE